MANGFQSPSVLTKSSKALNVAKATGLTEKMGLIFSDIEDPREGFEMCLP
ncbi:MAG: hypothetical protein F6K65_27035 [Moorea sp. SIO3C2]|nr:hypothetical protein [Moorena sp. SIO3C2]